MALIYQFIIHESSKHQGTLLAYHGLPPVKFARSVDFSFSSGTSPGNKEKKKNAGPPAFDQKNRARSPFQLLNSWKKQLIHFNRSWLFHQFSIQIHPVFPGNSEKIKSQPVHDQDPAECPASWARWGAVPGFRFTELRSTN